MMASSNYGNMFSVLVASILLPFLPMMSLQLITLNMIYDFSCASIPWDNVDEEFILKPRKRDASGIGRFMMWFGPAGSVFDFLTYAFMYFIVCPTFVSGGILFNSLSSVYSGAILQAVEKEYIALFQAGWFIESMWTQSMVIHMIRTPKLPFIESRAGASVTISTLLASILATALPFTAVGRALGFVSLPTTYFIYLLPCLLLYMILATLIKKEYIRRYGELL